MGLELNYRDILIANFIIKIIVSNISHPLFQSLRPALLNVREMCYRISDMGLCKVEKGHTYTLVEFRDAQFATLNEVIQIVRIF